MSKTYKITLTEEQARVTMIALEEYFRLRMGQDYDFSQDMAGLKIDFSKEKPVQEEVFARYISRRDHLNELMRAYFRIAFEPEGYLKEKTEDMMIAECIWDAIRYKRGLSRWDEPFQIGREPSPRIEVYEEA